MYEVVLMLEADVCFYNIEEVFFYEDFFINFIAMRIVNTDLVFHKSHAQQELSL